MGRSSGFLSWLGGRRLREVCTGLKRKDEGRRDRKVVVESILIPQNIRWLKIAAIFVVSATKSRCLVKSETRGLKTSLWVLTISRLFQSLRIIVSLLPFSQHAATFRENVLNLILLLCYLARCSPVRSIIVDPENEFEIIAKVTESTECDFLSCKFTFSSSGLKKKMSSCFKNSAFLPRGEVVCFELYWSECPEAVGMKLNKFLKIDWRSPSNAWGIVLLCASLPPTKILSAYNSN